LLNKGYGVITAWDRAAEVGKKEILETLWYWGRVVQINLKDDLFLSNGYDGLAAFDRAIWKKIMRF